MFCLARRCVSLSSSLRSSLPLSGKVAVVTGAASGIGRATAKLLAENGAKVQAIDVDLDGLKSLKSELAHNDLSQSQCAIFKANVRNDQEVQQYMREIYESNGNAIHILANIAGIVGAECFAPFHTRTLADMRALLDINVYGSLLNCHTVIPYMLSTLQAMQDKDNTCAIINTSSVVTDTTLSGMCDYTTSKHAVNGLTQTLAVEYGASGIRINAVKPGYTLTNMLRGAFAQVDMDVATVEEVVRGNTPMQRLATVEEIAEMFLFLADNQRSSFVNGSLHSVDGGCGIAKQQFDSFLVESKSESESESGFEEQKMPLAK